MQPNKIYKKCNECRSTYKMKKRQRYCDHCKDVRYKRLKQKRNKNYYQDKVKKKKEFLKLLKMLKYLSILEGGGQCVPPEYLKDSDTQCPCCFKIYTMTNKDTDVSREQHKTGLCSTICWDKFVTVI